MCENGRSAGRRYRKDEEGGLADYQIYRKMLQIVSETADRGGTFRANDRVMLGMRMREIERSLRELPPGDARILLELHYLQGLSIERCAERLYVSRATAYRLKSRALAQMAERGLLPPAHT